MLPPTLLIFAHRKLTVIICKILKHLESILIGLNENRL